MKNRLCNLYRQSKLVQLARTYDFFFHICPCSILSWKFFQLSQGVHFFQQSDQTYSELEEPWSFHWEFCSILFRQQWVKRRNNRFFRILINPFLDKFLILVNIILVISFYEKNLEHLPYEIHRKWKKISSEEKMRTCK